MSLIEMKNSVGSKFDLGEPQKLKIYLISSRYIITIGKEVDLCIFLMPIELTLYTIKTICKCDHNLLGGIQLNDAGNCPGILLMPRLINYYHIEKRYTC